jgi:hypothetical protein
MPGVAATKAKIAARAPKNRPLLKHLMQTEPPLAKQAPARRNHLQGFIAAASRLPGKADDAGIITEEPLQISYRLIFLKAGEKGRQEPDFSGDTPIRREMRTPGEALTGRSTPGTDSWFWRKGRPRARCGA